MNFAHSAKDFEDSIREYEEEAGQWLDFSKLKTTLVELQIISKSLVDQTKTKELNRVLLMVARCLNPVLFQSKSAFEHDPALSSRCLPGLSKALSLKDLDPNSDAMKFDLVGLKREMNRINHSLLNAKSLIFNWLRDEKK